ncbi:hypothetical protein DY000_02046460 [Brassica cretica]|uniref:Uncharacterized protein n=1 Tax=Brassica cretica TaxID=69181 RepID=A0ABQ7F4P6_BRACR|nr:hypothetical protein DY000_02046460 [Brassica cretica]
MSRAFADNKVIELDPTLARAYLRKVLRLEEYSTAKATPNDTKFKRMIAEFNLHIAGEEKDLAQQMPPTYFFILLFASILPQHIFINKVELSAFSGYPRQQGGWGVLRHVSTR